MIYKTPFPADIKKDDSLLEGYGPGTIKNIGATSLKVAFRDRSINTKFNIVYAPGKPSVIGCAEAQQLGIITVNIDDTESKAGANVNNSTDEIQSKAGADMNKSADHIQSEAGADVNKSTDHTQSKAGANVAASTITSTSKPQEDEDWDKDLTLPPPTVEWGHFVTQLNQDPGEDSVADLGPGTAAMEEGDADTVGDKEVEGGDGEATANVIPDMGITDLTWDPQDLYLEIDDESSGAHQIPMAALTPISMPTKEIPLCHQASRDPRGRFQFLKQQ